MRMNEQERCALAAQAAVTASLLDMGSYVAQISIAVLMLGLLLQLLAYPLSQPLLFAAIGAALVQGYFALRVRFDANIFRSWAGRWYAGADPKADMNAFDRHIGRKAEAPADVKVGLTARRNGALRLWRLQIACLVVQLLMTAIAL